MAIQKDRFLADQPPPCFDLTAEQDQEVLNSVLLPLDRSIYYLSPQCLKGHVKVCS